MKDTCLICGNGNRGDHFCVGVKDSDISDYCQQLARHKVEDEIIVRNQSVIRDFLRTQMQNLMTTTEYLSTLEK